MDTISVLSLPLQITPIERLSNVSQAVGCDVWIKRDDLTNGDYGGNKPRKLARILAHAQELGCTSVVTSGTAGSHHVLATAIHAQQVGLKVHAVVAPQPRSDHAVQVAYQAQLRGVQYTMVRNKLWLPFAAQWLQGSLKRRGEKSFLIPLGGSSVEGCAGYFQAMIELLAQMKQGAMGGQLPSVIVCPHGSGGTHAGLLAAVRALRLATKVVGVQVAAPWSVPRVRASVMAERVIALQSGKGVRVRAAMDLSDVHITNEFFGNGYGAPSAEGDRATALFARDGIELDPTYTAKSAAAIGSIAREYQASSVLYWHTLSSAPLPSVEQAQGLSAELRALLV